MDGKFQMIILGKISQVYNSNNPINPAATIAGPNGRYVLCEGFSLKPFKINTQLVSPIRASNIALIV